MFNINTTILININTINQVLFLLINCYEIIFMLTLFVSYNCSLGEQSFYFISDLSKYFTNHFKRPISFLLHNFVEDEQTYLSEIMNVHALKWENNYNNLFN